MKKRLISLVLTAAMLFSVMLTGCGSTATDEENQDAITSEASRYTTTLNMWVVTNESTTAEAAAAVNEAFNKITKAKFKTQVNIKFYTEDEYYDAIEEKLVAIEAEVLAEEEARKARRQAEKEARARGETLATTTVEETEVTEEETVLNEWGISELKYPEESSRQIDIIFVSGYDRLVDYADRGILQSLNSELKSGSKKLKDYINPALLEAAALGGTTYAIPNNQQLGEYTFLLINREMAEKYNYVESEFTNLSFAMSFVKDVAAHESDITPIVGDLDIANVRYLSLDSNTLEFIDQPSIVAAQQVTSAVYGDFLSFRNIFKITSYKTQVKDILNAKINNWYDPNASLDEPFLVAMMKGGADIMEKYNDEYFPVILEYPTLTRDEVFEGMFGVTEYTKDLTRSMEIVTYLNTNSELRNILQYGIEGVNYTIDADTGVLTMLNDTYSMDIAKTGNAFVAYHPEKGNDPTAWDAAKKQNQDVRLDLLYDFSFVGSEVEKELVEKIAKMSEECFAKVEACTTLEELDAVLNELDTMLTTDPTMLAFSSAKTEYTSSVYHIYNAWYTEKWPNG